MQKWPNYSDNWEYAVPHPTLKPDEAYNTVELWADDEYGDNRRELCLWLADQLKEEN
jgi:hypothetical protein